MTFKLSLAGTETAFEKDTVNFGRTSDNDVVVADPAASRSHARISFRGGAFVVEDLGSGNGTKLNGAKLTTAVPLNSGDTITIGDTVYTFLSDSTVLSNPVVGDETLLKPLADTTSPPGPSPLAALSASDSQPIARLDLPGLHDSQPISDQTTVPPSRAPVGDSTVPHGHMESPERVSDSTLLRPPPDFSTEKNPVAPKEDPNATMLRPPSDFALVTDQNPIAKKNDVADLDTRDVHRDAMTAAERMREKREANKSVGGQLRYAWKQLPENGRRAAKGSAIVAGLAVALLIVLSNLPKQSNKAPEPNELQVAADSIEASFGVGDDITYPRRDMKVFTFTAAGATRLVGVLHYQARDISKDEVSVALNGFDLGFVPPDTLDTENREMELVLPAQQVKKGQPNQLVFDNIFNPPGEEAWRIWNVRLELIAIPDLSPEETVSMVTQDVELARNAYDQREIGPDNLFKAWKTYRDAWLKLESITTRPEGLYVECRTRQREILALLDARCRTMQLEVLKLMSAKRPDRALARETLLEALRYYPTREHRCHSLAHALLDDVGGPQ